METLDQTKTKLPIIPLRGLTVLPGEIMHCDIGRKKTLLAMEQALSADGLALLCMQEDQKRAEIDETELYRFGTVCRLRQVFRIRNDAVHLLVTGIARAHIEEFTAVEPYFEAKVAYLTETEPDAVTQETLRRRLTEGFLAFTQEKDRLTSDQRDAILSISEFSAFVDAVGQQCATKVLDKQQLVETADAEARAMRVLEIIENELEIMKIDHRIAAKIKEAADRNQREFVLREQLKAVQEELGIGEASEAADYRSRMEKLTLPDYVKEKLEKEIDRFDALPRGSHEQPMAQAYIECLLELPWTERTEDNLDLQHARSILDRDHYGMKKVKERIVEMLAVQKLTGDPQGQILCLVGPPGVGKTSIAKAIAEAMGRRFVRMSLGGVHDEAEIRGHRRTYIGARPGRIIEAMRQAKTVNPLLLFDEIDKLSDDMRGDPASAMLEVLDSAQNNAFVDHFVEIPYDLSRCLLMTTANDASSIPRPLLDRMEVIEVPSYLFDEKLEIARRHLLPRQLKKHGLTRSNLRADAAALSCLIEGYTREAGVRELDRVLGSVCRKAACEIVEGKQRITLTRQRITDWLGPQRHRGDEVEAEPQVGVVTGLAWTSVGGETLVIEATALPGKGNLQLTGQLGDVMQESAHAALTFVRANAERLGIDPGCFEKLDLHVHVPEGAVPKDGPSAGIALMTALASALSGAEVRPRLAMTGEITLRGRVLPIGGLREKLLAALRAGVTTVLLPEKNREDLFDVPDEIKKALRIEFVSTADEVLRSALASPNAYAAAPMPGIKEEPHAAVCH
ncbi:MAG: endopeptidase La [Eubacteriales bacterium]|nr:endopeptidase La [Eubacteriales bacterium]